MKSWFVSILVVAATLLAACSTTPDFSLQNTPILDTNTPSLPPTKTSPQELYPTAITTPLPTSTSEPLSLWIADYVPNPIVDGVISQLGDQVQITTDQQTAAGQLDIGRVTPVAEWVYVFVAPFPTISDGITEIELEQAWQGTLDAGPFAGIPLMLSEETYSVFSMKWGDAPSGAVQIVAI